jgi:hypothetical protein
VRGTLSVLAQESFAMTSVHRHRTLAAALFIALLSACGGGDGSSAGGGFSGNPNDETAQSASANGLAVADDGLRAQAAVLAAARGVIAISGALGSVSCAGGGSAQFTASAGPSGSLTNGVPDAGETYRIRFDDCTSSSGSAIVDGTLTLDVNSASGEDLSVTTSSQLEVVLPQRTLVFSGNSTFSHTVQTSGSTRVETDRWTTPSISTASRRHGRTTILSLTGVDLTHRVTTLNGVFSSSTHEGSVTISYTGFLGSWSATIATDGLASVAIDGTPIAGRWLITLPGDLVVLTIAGNVATAALDLGRNNSIERTLTWPLLVLIAAAD